MAEPARFEVDGVPFEVRRLGVDETCQGLEMLAKALGPLLASEGETNWLAAIMGQASQIPALLRLFAPFAKVARTTAGEFDASGKFVDMKPFLNDVFGGKHARMLGFLVKAVQAEYGSFLADGDQLAALFPAPPPTAG